jgi:glycerol-3-phosphate dehydrogenase (NAD(P)+)
MTSTERTSVAVIGAGGWGTALAITLAEVHDRVRLWVYEPDLAETIRCERFNPVYLPGVEIPPGVDPDADLERVVERADIVVAAVPSHVCRGVFVRMLPFLRPEMAFVTATKGIENGSLMRMSEVIADVVGSAFPPRVAAISGPTFALEVARREPTALVVASPHADLRRALQQQLSTPRFRLYTNADIVGVEIGGAVKNIIAIAAGVVAGLELGHNTMAALVTRGLAEIMRLAEACGGRRDTLAGLAGLGDLVLTSTGHLSRNRQVGVALGRGSRLEEIVRSMRMVAEGVKTSQSTVTLARKLGVEMPIAEEVYSILYENKKPRDAISALMERELTEE